VGGPRFGRARPIGVAGDETGDDRFEQIGFGRRQVLERLARRRQAVLV
jgi:hypothetical protein